MTGDSFDADLPVAFEIFEELQRIAPELPADSGFVFDDSMALAEMLRRLRALPNGAGAAAVAAALDWPPQA